MRIAIVIPTYNEADNISLLLDALHGQFHHIPHEMLVLVVDDNSPDGTADIVRTRQCNTPWLHLLTGRKEGLGAAYIRGMTYAVDVLGADAVMEMDADFSHDPADVPRMIAALDAGADMVIGSRYVKGGSIPDDWGLHRKLNSKFGNIAARLIAGMHQVADCTAGFRAIRASMLRRIDLPSLNARGYVFQIALLHEMLVQGARITEIPVKFTDRTRGTTKLGLADIAEFLLRVWAIRLRSMRTFLFFCFVGATGVAVNLAGFTALLAGGVPPLLASPLAVEIAILWNFLLNNRLTFSKTESGRSPFGKLLRFNLASLAGLGVHWATFWGITHVFPTFPPLMAQTIAIAPSTVTNYVLYSRWVFSTNRLRSKISGIFRLTTATRPMD
ncbi:GtrA family protein [Nitratidesulfovibrio sp. D1]|uniref:GtrA family protein n=1 Tax=Nitratidesulfovibrio sp. D1 TaxID=3440151 RepID=UPI003EBBE995